MDKPTNHPNELIIYTSDKVVEPVRIAFDGETMWLTQDQIAALFETSVQNISQHIKSIYDEAELDRQSTLKKIFKVVENRPNYGVTHYNLDVVISVGYRVSSKVATRFRQWATGVIKERLGVEGAALLSKEQQRVMISERIAVENNELLKTAADMGVHDMPLFFDAGYQGMYKMRMPQIKEKKNLGKDRLLDRSGITELAANEFRITQTNDKIQKLIEEDKIVGHVAAITTHYKVGREVREAIERIGGVPPEDLEPEAEHIESVRKRVKSTDKKKLKS